MKFYHIRHDLSYQSCYAWSDGYSPLPSMPFFEELNDEFKLPRRGFWSVNTGPPGMTIYQGGSQWPDCLGVGLGWPHDVFSERIVSDLRTARIEIWRTTLMPIAEIKSKRLQRKAPPEYFVLEAERGIDVDYEASGIPMDLDGKPDFRARDKSKRTPISPPSSLRRLLR
jgi:hypothetical protein